MKLLLLLLLVIVTISTIEGSDVVKLTQSNFKENVLDSKIPFFVEFFAPWCGHCKALAPTWESAASNLKGVVKVGAVDCTVEQSICQRYGVQGYPTLKLFKGGKPTDYQQGRDAKSIVSFALNSIENNVVSVKDVDENKFWERSAELPHVLLFSAKTKVASLYKSLAMEYKGRLVLGQTSSDQGLDEKFSISKYPTVMVFPGGDEVPVVYDGAIDADKLREFLSPFAGETVKEAPKAKKPVVPPRTKELKYKQITEDNLADSCKKLCAIAFVETVEGSLSEESKSILDNLGKVYKSEKAKLSLGWVDKNDQAELSSKFNGASFIVYRPKNEKYTSSDFTESDTVTLISRSLGGDATWTSLN